MVSVPNPDNTPTDYTFPIVYRYVQIRKLWADDWETMDYLYPIGQATHASAPEVSECHFRRHFGSIRREGITGYQDYTPLELDNYYVRVLIQGDEVEPEVVWTGIFASETKTYDQLTTKSGTQEYIAYGLEHILDRIVPDVGYVRDRNSTEQVIGYLPQFNRVGGHGRRGPQIIGNKSFTAGNNGSFVFSYEDASIWSASDVVFYLLRNYLPDALYMSLKGMGPVLLLIEDAWDLRGMSIFQALNRLISPNRGLGWNLEVDEDDIYINVYTVIGQPITFGGKTLIANSNAQEFTLPTDYPWNHLCDDIPFRTQATDQIDTLIIRGERVQVTATWSFTDKTLTEGWDTTSLEPDYENATGAEGTPEDNDSVRAADRFSSVYTRFVVPADWDWKTKDGENGAGGNCAVTVNVAGILLPETEAPAWADEKVWLAQLPMHVGVDYSQPAAIVEHLADDSPEYRPILVLIKDDLDGEQHQADGNWHYAERLAEGNRYLRNISARPLDTRMGVQLGASPRHYLAGEQWDAGHSATAQGPELDYKQILVTATVETDSHFQVELPLSLIGESSAEWERKKIIRVHDAHLWYVVSGTVVDVSETGQLKRVGLNNRILRYDYDRIVVVAAFAAAWFGITRQAVRIPINRLGMYAPLGALITSISHADTTEVVRTPVTKLTWHWEANEGCGATVIETGWASIDSVPIPFNIAGVT